METGLLNSTKLRFDSQELPALTHGAPLFSGDDRKSR